MSDHLHTKHNCTKTLVQRTKKIRMQDILNLLHRKTTKVVIQKIILHKKNYIKNKIIKMNKMERVDGPLALHEIPSKKYSYILNRYILLNFIYIF
jgi:hypothetical protein